ncbi:hypothetical protein [Chryseobacterium camelliae]|uniref:hypothetical protein n=1 Tax=Chryseobacterium camelliae TaxID=1265445 RepID=UPI000C1CC0F3|nr:hypothetical protein [Chryseobacterium camelliae]
MTEAIFGLIGVFVGSGIAWFQSYWLDKRTANKNAKYLAIRIVCILDKYLEDCVSVVKDDGLSYGQRTIEGYLEPQVKAPGPPVYPEDVDWKSIHHELMFQLLSFPSEVTDGERVIKAALEITGPPNFEEWFEERRFYYSQFGLMAYKLSDDLCEKYGIRKKIYNDWDPIEDLKHELDKVNVKRKLRIEKYRKNSI